MSLRRHPRANPICRVPMLTENNTLADGKQGIEGDKDVVFVLLVPAVHVELPDGINAQFFFLQFNFICIGSEFGCKGADVVGEGGGEEDNLDLAFRDHA